MQLELSQYLIGFFGAGVAGFIDAIIGGGGLITTPLILSLGVPPHLALATSKLQSTMGASVALYSLRRQIAWREQFAQILLVAISAAAGAYTLLQVSNEALKPLILGLLCGVFIYTIFKPNLGKEQSKKRLSTAVFYAIFATILGFYDGFLGPGTGSFWIFALVLLQGCDLRSASVQTKLLNTTSNIAALALFLAIFDVIYSLGLIMGAGSMIGARLGAAYLLRANMKIIRAMFIFIVAGCIIKLAYEFAKSL